MKLLNCIACHDIVRIFREIRMCKCGRSEARYVNERMAEFTGPARIIGINSLDYHKGDFGEEHPWRFIPEEGDYIRRPAEPLD
jgi:hypothetical protein